MSSLYITDAPVDLPEGTLPFIPLVIGKLSHSTLVPILSSPNPMRLKAGRS